MTHLAYGAHCLVDVEHWRAPTAATIYEIGSNTKQFTSAPGGGGSRAVARRCDAIVGNYSLELPGGQALPISVMLRVVMVGFWITHFMELRMNPRCRILGRISVVVALLGIALPAHGQDRGEDTHGLCVPVSERAGRTYGCFILGVQALDTLTSAMFWHLETFPTARAATAAKGARGMVLASLGKVWLLTIADSGWRAPRGTHVATIGPLPVAPGTPYTAQYMEAVFRPGMKSVVHRHSGAEAWYTLTGETCLETPRGTQLGRAGGPTVIVPGGGPMELTATGPSTRRGLVLILHDSRQPASSPVADWTPKGLCTRRHAPTPSR